MAAVLEFGCVPSDVVRGLKDVGNWQVRADSIDRLQKVVQESSSIHQHLPELVQYLMQLLADPNFKVAMSAVTILGVVVAKAGPAIKPQVPLIVIGLLEKLGDSKITVRRSSTKVLQQMLSCTDVQSTLSAISRGLTHRSAQVREETVDIYTVALLQNGAQEGSIDHVKVVCSLLPALEDPSDKVRAVAMESLAVLHSLVGSVRLDALLRVTCMPPASQKLLQDRLKFGNLPVLDCEGCVLHTFLVEAASLAAGGGGRGRPASRSRRHSGTIALSSQFHLDSLGLVEAAAVAPAPAPPAAGPRTSSSWQDWGKGAAPSSSTSATEGPPLGRDAGAATPSPASSSWNSWGGAGPSPSAAAPPPGGRHVPLPVPGGAHRLPPRLSLDVAGGAPAELGSPPTPGSGSPASSAAPSPSRRSAVARSSVLGARPRDDVSPGHDPLGSDARRGGDAMWGRGADDATSDLCASPTHPVPSRLQVRRLHSSQDAVTGGFDASGLPREGPRDGEGPGLEDGPDSPRSAPWSPSKGQRLANLKRRQIANRARSAVVTGSPVKHDLGLDGLSPPPGHWEIQAGVSPSSSCGSGASLGAAPSLLQTGFATYPIGTRSPESQRLGGPTSPTCRAGSVPLPDGFLPQGGGAGRPMGRVRSAMAIARDTPPAEPDSPVAEGSPLHRMRSRGVAGPAATADMEVPYDGLQPVDAPEATLREVVAALQRHNLAQRKELDWAGQYETLVTARSLVKHHPEVVAGGLTDFVHALKPVTKALRSMTAKIALQVFQELFEGLGSVMDKQVDTVCLDLLEKAGEMSGSGSGRETFLAFEAERALAMMVQHCSPGRVMPALVSHAQHKSPALKQKVASQMDLVFVNSTSAMPRALVDKAFTAAASLLEEGMQDTRTHGKRIIWHVHDMCSSRPQFDGMVASLAKTNQQKKVRDVIDSGAPPNLPSKGKPSSRVGLRPRTFSRDDSISRANSAPMDLYPAPARSPARRGGRGGDLTPDAVTPTKGRPSPGLQDSPLARTGRPEGVSSPETATRRGSRTTPLSTPPRPDPPRPISATAIEKIEAVRKKLDGRDWRERLDGLEELGRSAADLSRIPPGQLQQILDPLIQRMSDGNPKVNLKALQTLLPVLETVGNNVGVTVNSLIPSLAANLGSTNSNIRRLAADGVDQLVKFVDPTMLVQNFAHVVTHGQQRGKPAIISSLAHIVEEVHAVKPALLVRHAIPAAFSLLNDSRGDMRTANNDLLVALAQVMGAELLTHASNLPQTSLQKLEQLLLDAQ